jgi:hypothetical protein
MVGDHDVDAVFRARRTVSTAVMPQSQVRMRRAPTRRASASLAGPKS